MSVTVLIADDSAAMRKAVKFFFNGRTDAVVAGEATNCTEAIQKIDDLRPDVVVLDLHMPDTYVEPIRLKERVNGTKVVAITFGNDAVAEALAEHIGADIRNQFLRQIHFINYGIDAKAVLTRRSVVPCRKSLTRFPLKTPFCTFEPLDELNCC